MLVITTPVMTPDSITGTPVAPDPTPPTAVIATVRQSHVIAHSAVSHVNVMNASAQVHGGRSAGSAGNGDRRRGCQIPGAIVTGADLLGDRDSGHVPRTVDRSGQQWRRHRRGDS